MFIQRHVYTCKHVRAYGHVHTYIRPYCYIYVYICVLEAYVAPCVGIRDQCTDSAAHWFAQGSGSNGITCAVSDLGHAVLEQLPYGSAAARFCTRRSSHCEHHRAVDQLFAPAKGPDATSDADEDEDETDTEV